MRMGPGRAFAETTPGPDPRQRLEGARIQKQFQTWAGRKLLIEAVEYERVKAALDRLPVSRNWHSSLRSPQDRPARLAANASVPPIRALTPRKDGRIQVAAVSDLNPA
jgi:hypothetical protein